MALVRTSKGSDERSASQPAMMQRMTNAASDTEAEAVLDHPIWHALTGPQREFARVGTLAARYEPEVAVFAALAEHSPKAFEELASMSAQRDFVVLFEDVQLDEDAPWRVAERLEVAQMVYRGDSTLDRAEALTLGTADVEEMTALVEATEPGPFSPRTIELGTYLGVRDDAELIAMAGERFALDGFREVSGVCTSERARGRGLAGGLVQTLVEEMTARSERPFLHVRIGSPSEASATGVYERGGFRTRRILPVSILVRNSR